MSQIVRQSNLFAAEDFVKIYKSFQDIDFTAYDFDTIRDAMITYIQAHFPEDFNDYVESSEFIAIIELLAFLGTSLAFRADLNSRENILDTAERRESIIRLARMINYSPSRNIPLTGLFKISSVSTTQPLVDSDGVNIGNVPIFWADANNPNWFDQYIQIVNSALNPVNPYGRPTKSGTVGSIPTDLYQMNNVTGLEVAYPLNLTVNGQSIPIDVVNPDFEFSFFERAPDPNQNFNLIYRNDSLGVSSNNTGFFLHFRQGQLTNQDNTYEFPVSNRITAIDATNINNSDVYVQEISDAGTVVQQWDNVPSVSGTNVIYNSVNFDNRSIYEIISENDDAISLKFADGDFGNIPTGIFRTWYRTSINRNVTIRPEDARGIKITIPYTGVDNQQYNLTLNFDLEQTVNNGATSETNGQIKLRAPQTYYTQERMINNEDYNVFPLTFGNTISKIRAINRTYAGHSRFIDVNDPTGFHQNLIVLGDDGALYRDSEDQREIIEITNSITGIVSETVYTDFTQFIKNNELRTFFYNEYLNNFTSDAMFGADYFKLEQDEFPPNDPKFEYWPQWKTSPDKYNNDTGYLEKPFNETDPENNYVMFDKNPLMFIKSGATLIFDSGEGTSRTSAGVMSVVNLGVPTDPVITDVGPVELSSEIIDKKRAVEVVPNFRTVFTVSEEEEIIEELSKFESFGIGYDLEVDQWYIIRPSDDSNVAEIPNTIDAFELIADDAGNIDRTYSKSWLVRFVYDPGDEQGNPSYEMISRGVVIVFESYRQARFYWDPEQQVFDVQTGKSLQDSIEILPGINFDVNDVPLEKTIIWQLDDVYIQEDGYQDPTKIEVLPADLNEDGTADNPDGFDTLVKDSDYIIFENYIDIDGYEKTRPWATGWITEIKESSVVHPDYGNGTLSDMSFVGSNPELDPLPEPIKIPVSRGNLIEIKEEALQSLAQQLTNDYNATQSDEYPDPVQTKTSVGIFMSNIATKSFRYEGVAVGANKYYILQTITNISGLLEVEIVLDPSHFEKNGISFTQNTNVPDDEFQALSYRWKHYAPTDQRIDPSASNIIDMLLVTEAYYKEVLLWKDEDRSSLTFPNPPTTEELRIEFGELDRYKATSDQIVYNSGKFKILFGAQAEPELQAVFKAVKIPSATISDSELKTKIIESIDLYFDINNWDFGETFYYTELAAYIHTQLTKFLSSIVIVPTKEESEFGNLFEIVSNTDELFISTATVADVIIVSNFTETNLRL